MIRRSFRVAMLLALAPASVAAQQSPPRIVTLSAAITEIVFALGAGDAVVGVPTGVVHPAEATRRTAVGAARQLGAEGILAQRPTLVLADSTLDAALRRQLERAGSRVVLVSGAETAAAAASRIRAIGALLERGRAADSMATALERRLAAVVPDPVPTRVLFVYARGAGTLMVSGAGTSADEMLRLARVRNAVEGFSGFRPLTAEAVIAARPDVILLPARGLASLGGVEAVLRLPGIALTPAGRGRRVIALDDTLLLGFGPRLAEAVAQLAQAIARAAS